MVRNLDNQNSDAACRRQVSQFPGAPIALHSRVLSYDGLGGGDLVDVRRGSARSLGVTLGDVSGHGLEALPFSADVRRVLDTLDETHRNEASWLQALNNAVADEFDDEHFCAAISASLDWSPDDDSVNVDLAVAGMPSPMVVRTDGTVEAVDLRALPLGILRDDAWSAATTQLTLEHGEMLVLFSDGLTEARDDTGTMFGMERLAQLIGSLSAAGGAGVLRGVLSAIRRHCPGQVLQDDCSLAVVEVRGGRRACEKRAA